MYIWDTKAHYIFKSPKSHKSENIKGQNPTSHKGLNQLGEQTHKPNPSPKTRGTTPPRRERRISSPEEEPDQHLQQKKPRRRISAKREAKTTSCVKSMRLKSGAWRSRAGGMLPDRDNIEDLESLKSTKGHVLVKEHPAVAEKYSLKQHP